MARQTEVVFVLLLAMAATAFGKLDSRCPDGWVKFGGRCFKYQATSMDWASAEKYCLNIGANLISIHNEGEYQQVKSIIRAQDPQEKPTWIGLSSCQKKLNWFWSDGTQLTFTKWNPGEPNSLTEEFCAHMNYGATKNWNDIRCDQSYPFVCVKRIV
ncbi:hypothetical protein PHYPO_G00190160 [Pangasianodon hypophthalmus]|uniref:C-type lectin domain-containing protein n=1 Tax=Pangasianodon hypophthalmus TaxID=310915 RepID=A0A5N5PHN8_PANHP|nr:lactose-binding lectin l-2-like [Pangasianodon hypophthalmus]XP_053089655.1 lactose-binding lectin l-2 [Pangasianodon hypophthalmus]KAB5579042.1 hypothetical protein PHYPO_G00190160 [Pangasianodon hypophthalmus]